VATRVDIRGGTLVGRYRVERLLGRGGMSTVYVARDLEVDCAVALKVIAPRARRRRALRKRLPSARVDPSHGGRFPPISRCFLLMPAQH
jgi:hypothetical protein